MSRKATYPLLTCLLCLMPMLSFAQSLTHLEYWFDDGFDNKRAISLSGTEYEVDTEISTTGLKNGMHKLWYRVRRSDKMYSPISSSTFFKYQFADGMKLEYWVDDNYEHAQTFDGRLASDGKDYIFVNELDLGNVTPGHHRLYCRAITSDDQAATAITSMPIIVKSLYNIDPKNAEMKYYSIAVDDEDPVELSFPHPGHVVDVDHLLDTRHLQKGTYQLKLRLANTMGAAINVEQEFTVNEPSEPTITLTATENNGLVSIRFNSIPNDKSYNIYRVDANGASEVIRHKRVSSYPTDICYTDNPRAGTYTYYARSAYNDIDGNNKNVKSNEVSVTVAQQQTALGYIEGEIYYDGKRKVGRKSNLMFTDGVVVQSNEDGVFRRDRIPMGSELGVYLTDNDYYISDIARVTIDKGRNYARVNASKRFEYPVNNQIDYGLLTLDGSVKWEPGAYFKFPLTNYTHETFVGRLCVKAIPKRFDNEEETPSVSYNDPQVFAGSVANMPFIQTTNYQLFYSDDFQLGFQGYKEILVPLYGFHNSGPTELFNFYVYSVDSDGSKSLVWPNHRYETSRNNPIEHMIEGGMADEDKVAYYTNLIVYFCSTVKELDKLIGKASDVLWYKKDRLESDYYYLTHATEEGELESEGMQEVVEQMMKDCDYYSNEVKSFRNKIAPIVRECKSIKELWGYVKKGVDAIKEYKQLTSMNDYEKSIYLSKKIIDIAGDVFDKNNPFTPILKSYLDITEVIIEKVLNLGWAYNQPWIPIDMSDNKLKIKVKVIKKDGSAIPFKLKGNGLIERVVVKGWNKSEDKIAEARFRYVSGTILDWNCAVFEQEATDNVSNLDLGGATPFQQLWAEVYWRNGRVSCVPLTEIGAGVSYEHAEQSNSIFTITFVSAVNEYTYAADVIHLKE